MERSLLEGDDRTGLGIDSVQDEPIPEKQEAHTAVREPSNGAKHTSFGENGERGIGLQDGPGDGEEALASKSEQLPQSSQRISGTHHPSYHHEAYEKV